MSGAASRNYGRRLIDILHTRGSLGLDTQVSACATEELCSLEELYGREEYACLANDRGRNMYFAAAIKFVLKIHGDSRPWLEIGPGGNACLTKIVLANSGACVYAIEGNPSAIKPFRQSTKSFGSRVQVVQGLVGGSASLQIPRHLYSVLLSEIIGHIATIENCVSIFSNFGRSNPEIAESIQDAIPRFFGTGIVPVNLQRETTQQLTVAAVLPRLALVDHIPFEQLCTFDGDIYGQVFEAFDTLDILRNPDKYTRALAHTLEWVNRTNEDAHIDGFAMYMFIGNPGKHSQVGYGRDEVFSMFKTVTNPHNAVNARGVLSEHESLLPGANVKLFSTNHRFLHSQVPFSTNWHNVFLPINATRIVLRPNDCLRCTVVNHVDRAPIVYELRVDAPHGQSTTVGFGSTDVIRTTQKLRNYKVDPNKTQA